MNPETLWFCPECFGHVRIDAQERCARRIFFVSTTASTTRKTPGVCGITCVERAPGGQPLADQWAPPASQWQRMAETS